MLIDDYKMVPTTKEVYQAIYATTKDTLGVYSSFTNMEPSRLSSRGEIWTEWCVKGTDAPIIGYKERWDFDKPDDREIAYFILGGIEVNESFNREYEVGTVTGLSEVLEELTRELEKK